MQYSNMLSSFLLPGSEANRYVDLSHKNLCVKSHNSISAYIGFLPAMLTLVLATFILYCIVLTPQVVRIPSRGTVRLPASVNLDQLCPPHCISRAVGGGGTRNIPAYSVCKYLMKGPGKSPTGYHQLKFVDHLNSQAAESLYPQD